MQHSRHPHSGQKELMAEDKALNIRKRWETMNPLPANSKLTETGDYISMNAWKKRIGSLKVFYAFARPYASIGVIWSVASYSLIATENLSDISLPLFIGLLEATLAFGCLSIYTNGINQLFDIDIDKVSKSYLPLASGMMTLKAGAGIASFFALMAFGIAIITGSRPLFWGIFLGFLIASAYSVDLPLLRWKKSALGAAFSVVLGCGIVRPLATYLHIRTFVLDREANFSGPLIFGTIALSIFFVVLAFFKDIPDIEGDKKFGVRSLAILIGQEKVFWICVYLLQMVYIFGIVVGATSSDHSWRKLIIILSRIVLSSNLWKKAKSADLKNKSAIACFYMFMWKLLYAEYFLIPLVR